MSIGVVTVGTGGVSLAPTKRMYRRALSAPQTEKP